MCASGKKKAQSHHKPFWVVRKLLVLSSSDTAQIVREDESWISSVWIQSQGTERGRRLHLFPDVKAQVTQVFGHISQRSEVQL